MEMKACVTRRTVLRGTLVLGLGTALASLAACAAPSAPPAATPPPPTTAAQQPTQPAAKPAPQPTVSKPAPTVAATAAPAKAPVEMSIRHSFFVVGHTFSPVFAAREQGFFTKRGLSVSQFEGQGSTSVLQLINSGGNTLGEVGAPVMMGGVQQGMDVRMIACLWQRNTFGVLSPADAPLRKPQDLEGKSIAGQPGGAGEVQLPIFAKKAGIDVNKVNFVNTDQNGKYTALLSRRVDGAIFQIPGDRLIFESQNFPVAALYFGDNGVAQLGNGLIALNRTLSEQPGIVRAFLAALLEGWDYTKAHLDDVVALAKKYFPDNKSTPEVLGGQFKAYQDFLRTERTKDKPLFWMDKGDWEETQAVLLETGTLKSPLSVERYYTNEFLPAG